MAPFEALYGRKCKTPLHWLELNESKLVGVDLIRETEEKVQIIRDCLKAASDRQKSYADLKRREIEFNVGDQVFLKVSPWKKVLRFGRKGKLSLRFIGPYKIIERVGPVAYRENSLVGMYDDITLTFDASYCTDWLDFAMRKLDRTAIANFCMFLWELLIVWNNEALNKRLTSPP
ncbi:uncharacterized protein LOC128285375 [Gossypium arboreum]|uniref:uncharacterized protein LOC128285375 n=1 Tax=Gossypium arboreum TaxID=29729 RepID=UPI0022F1DA3B|nr:uncharacterized protein LOC128285375 [Gossypium arboreum]